MSQYVITNGRIYTEAQVIEKGYLVVENGKISDIQKGDYKGHLNQIDVAGKHVLPGFIDIHIHGRLQLRYLHLFLCLSFLFAYQY